VSIKSSLRYCATFFRSSESDGVTKNFLLNLFIKFPEKVPQSLLSPTSL
jgi:hypothetical protein